MVFFRPGQIKRQTKILEAGDKAEEKLIQETRGWDETTGTTFRQRVKETAADYRYFPEPDLPPLTISEEKITELKATLPELPNIKLKRFVNEYQFNPEIAEMIERISQHFADFIRASLYFGDLSLMTSEIAWADILVGNNNMNGDLMKEFLQMYHEVVEGVMGEKGNIIHNWLASFEI